MDSDTELEIGVIGRPHGVRGALRLWLHNAASDLIEQLESVIAESGDGRTREQWTIRRVASGPKGSRVLTVAEVDGRGAASERVGWRLVLPKAALPELADDEFYYHELAGWSAFLASGGELGVVREVIETSVDVLIIQRPAPAGELLLPVLEDVVLEVDRPNRRVVVADDAPARFD